MKIIFATKNQGKLKEVRAILHEFDILSLEDIGIDIEIDENGETFSENAIKKAVEIMKLTGEMVLADDSGLEIDYLGGEPGVHSARYLGESTSYDIKNAKILDMLKNARGKERSARYVAVIAAALPNGRVITTEGVMEGAMAHEAKGENGFGYDPIFLVPEFNMSVAQMEPAAKNKISHRGIALRLMRDELLKLNIL